jgi:sugar (pentulose or hexulose) kinase
VSSSTCTLSIDCGTQSIRTLIFDEHGNLLAMEREAYEPYIEEHPGWAEQDAQVYWDSLQRALTRLRKHADGPYRRIRGIGVTTQRNSMICLDEQGDPLRNVILWLDQRKASIIYRPGLLRMIGLKVVGMYDTVMKMQTEGACNWIKEYEPEIWERTCKYVQISGFLHKRMTGRWRDSTASQIGHIPFDYKKQRWAGPYALTGRIYPVEREKLVDLVSPGERIGTITDAFALRHGLPLGTPVIACGSDKGCETIGMGVVASDAGSLSFGTTATIETTCTRYLEPLKFLPSYPAPIAKQFNPEVEIFRGFWMITWFKEQFGFKEVQEAALSGISPEQLLDQMLDQTEPGAMGLMVQPYWSPGLKHPTAKGAMVGFGSVHTRAHIYRAMIEGLCFALLDGKHRIEKVTGTTMKSITVSGGASSSDHICRIAADVFGLPLHRGSTTETSGLGAACITQYGIGTYESVRDAVGAMVSYKDTFMPSEEHHRLYRRMYRLYGRIFPSLKRIYRKMGNITEYHEF